MTERRCPNCGGLVGANAEWCTQCLTRLNGGEARPDMDEPAPAPSVPDAAGQRNEAQPEPEPPPPRGPSPSRPTPRSSEAEAAERVVRAKGDRIVWDCPLCGTENPIEVPICSACGTPFRRVLQEPEEPIGVDPGRAAMLSLVFPGLGHFVARRRGEGIARAIIFAFALATGLASLSAVRSGSPGPYLPLVVLTLGAAGVLYVASTMDAGRAVRREPQLLQTRVLLYGAAGLMLLVVGLLTVAALQARGPAG